MKQVRDFVVELGEHRDACMRRGAVENEHFGFECLVEDDGVRGSLSLELVGEHDISEAGDDKMDP